LFLLTVGALLTYRTVFRLLDAQSWVSHSHQVQSALANITVVIGRAGRDRVEYVQAGDPARLAAYHASAREAPSRWCKGLPPIILCKPITAITSSL
jgi:hypothetical protein